MNEVRILTAKTCNDFVASNLRNLTSRELIKYCDNSDDPIIRELAKRLELCLDFATKQAGL